MGSDEVGWMRDSVAGQILFTVHEAFHGYQLKHFTWERRQLLGTDLGRIRPHHALFDSSWVMKSLLAEREALHASLAAPSCRLARDGFASFHRLRERRLGSMPAVFDEFERYQELLEGVATWVGYEGLHRVVTAEKDGALRSVLRDLRFAYLKKDGEPYEGYELFLHYHIYVAGAAKTALLSRCGSPTWKSELQGGKSPQELLERWITGE